MNNPWQPVYGAEKGVNSLIRRDTGEKRGFLGFWVDGGASTNPLKVEK